MANLKNLKAFVEPTKNKRVKVGNNREALTSTDGDFTYGYLHGHEIFVLNRARKFVDLKCHGFRTMTTARAMADFLGAIGMTGRVSFAKDGFSARVNGEDYVSNHDELRIHI